MAVTGDEVVQLGHARAQSLYAQYYPNVYRYALSQLRSPQDAEDAAQNTFLRAFAALQKGVVPESEAAWLFKIAHNVCASSKLAWLRRRRVEMPRDLDEVQVAALEPDADLTGLDDALASMPPRLREAFLLREWQGLSYAEIAERLDTSRSAVETLIFRARRHLANELRRVQQALTLGPLSAWLRGFFSGGGGGLVRGAGLVAVAAAGVATAAVVTPAQHSGGGGQQVQPARTGPQQAVRAGIVAPALPVVGAPARGNDGLVVSTQAAAATVVPGSSPGPATTAPTAPGAAAAATPPRAATTTEAAVPVAPPPPAVAVPTTTVAVPSPPFVPPSLTTPSATIPSPPAATVPSATVPSVTVPPVTTPVATTPSLTTPSVTIPSTLP